MDEERLFMEYYKAILSGYFSRQSQTNVPYWAAPEAEKALAQHRARYPLPNNESPYR